MDIIFTSGTFFVAKVQKPLLRFVMSMVVSDTVLTLQAMQSFYVQKSLKACSCPLIWGILFGENTQWSTIIKIRIFDAL